jgi:hypothetical protein
MFWNKGVHSAKVTFVKDNWFSHQICDENVDRVVPQGNRHDVPMEKIGSQMRRISFVKMF